MNTQIDENNNQYTVTAKITNKRDILYSVYNAAGELIEHVFSKCEFTKVAVYRTALRPGLSHAESSLREVTAARDDLERHLNEDDDRRTDEYEEILEAQLHDFELQIADLQNSIKGYRKHLLIGQEYRDVRIAFYEADDTNFAIEAAAFQKHGRPTDKIVVLEVPEASYSVQEDFSQAVA